MESGEGEGYDRKQAAIAVAPFLLLGLADVVLLLGWGLDPLWGFMILPPILFVSVLAWLGFRTGFVGARASPGDGVETEGNAGQPEQADPETVE